MRALRIGSRGSPLALWQAAWVRDRLRALGRAAEIEIIRTSGDRLAERPLAAMGGKGVFVREIEEALLAGRVDLAVHSLKDLPTGQPAGLVLACIPEREDPHDLLIAPGAPGLEALPPGAAVGTGSPRRACQLRARRPDLEMRDLRGNVDTRLRRLREGRYDAIVLARAGVTRLGLPVEAAILDFDTMLPAVGQGALAIETREEDRELRALLGGLHHPPTAAAVAAERAFLRGLGGGCQAPIAAVGEVAGATLRLRGLVADPRGETVLRESQEGTMARPEEAGEALARALLGRGAAALVAAPATPEPA